MKKIVTSFALVTMAAFGASAAQASLPGFTVSVEAPGVVNSSASFDYFGVETFDSRAPGGSTFTSTFNGSPITGVYTGVTVLSADQYGGANGTGQYAVALGQGSSYSVNFSSTGANGINYFGYWLSALDSGNTVEFFNGSNSLGTFDPANVLSFVGGNNAYFGNPSAPFLGQDGGQPFVFVNFFLNSGTFDRIEFRQTAIGGYESDNHTVGWFRDTGGGTVIPGVPEPSTWGMMILGFGAVGGVMRARKSDAKVAVTST